MRGTHLEGNADVAVEDDEAVKVCVVVDEGTGTELETETEGIVD